MANMGFAAHDNSSTGAVGSDTEGEATWTSINGSNAGYPVIEASENRAK